MCFLALLFSFLFISGREAHLINVVKKQMPNSIIGIFVRRINLYLEITLKNPLSFFQKTKSMIHQNIDKNIEKCLRKSFLDIFIHFHSYIDS